MTTEPEARVATPVLIAEAGSSTVSVSGRLVEYAAEPGTVTRSRLSPERETWSRVMSGLRTALKPDSSSACSDVNAAISCSVASPTFCLITDGQ